MARFDPVTRRAFLAGAGSLLVGAGPARAQTAEEDLVASLEAQGFEVLRVRRTWLGRIRILAQNGNSQREVVLNPSTGVILRDYTRRSEAASQPATSSSNDDDNRSRAPASSTASSDSSSSSSSTAASDDNETSTNDDNDARPAPPSKPERPKPSKPTPKTPGGGSRPPPPRP